MAKFNVANETVRDTLSNRTISVVVNNRTYTGFVAAASTTTTPNGNSGSSSSSSSSSSTLIIIIVVVVAGVVLVVVAVVVVARRRQPRPIKKTVNFSTEKPVKKSPSRKNTVFIEDATVPEVSYAGLEQILSANYGVIGIDEKDVRSIDDETHV